MNAVARDYITWRDACRRLLAAEVPPNAVYFSDGTEPNLFGGEVSPSAPSKYPVPKPFLDLAQKVACHREPQRWLRLYRALWRLTHGEPHLFDLASDNDVLWLTRAEKAVRRDSHKMKAFVRFRRTDDGCFIAWHRPDHRIVHLTAPFFARRFPQMDWSILTPDESVAWDQTALHFGPGVPAKDAPKPDQLEELWKTYYGSIFNPARIKLKAMRKELPVRHWPTLPETAMIPQLLADAPARVERMIALSEGFAKSAQSFMPSGTDLPSLKQSAKLCQACDLCHHATQTVFGEGPANARIMLVGEQPGDQEDRVGRPFIGPAGQLLDDALQQAGLDRQSLYLTNTVKHFKFDLKGDFRQHHRPDVREITACRPWLVRELEIVRPKVIVCLGATATRAVLGPTFRFTDRRGEVVASEFGPQALATYHPAAILRGPTPERAAEMKVALVRNLKAAKKLAGT